MSSRVRCWAVLLGLLLAARAHAAWVPGTGTLVAAGQLPSGRIVAIPDGAGGAFVLTHSTTGFPNLTLEARHVAADGAMAPGWPAGGVVVCSSGATTFGCYEQRLNELSACPDGAGGLFVAWGDAPFLNGAAAFGVTARIVRLGADGAPVAGWPAGGLLVSDGAGQVALTVYPDDAGGAYVAWRENRNLAVSDVAPHLFLQHFRADGVRATGFPARGRLIGAELSPFLLRRAVTFVPDPGGGVWALSAMPSSDVTQAPGRYRVVRLDRAANAPFDPLEVPGVDADAQTDPPAPAALFPDGSGGAWVTISSPARGGCFASHVAADGTWDPGFPADGLALAATADQRAEPDGAGGFYVEDTSVFELLRLTHLLPSGAADPAWPATPVPAAGPRDARLFPAADGGVLVAGWSLPYTIHCSPYVGFALVGRLLADGSTPPTWPASGPAFPAVPLAADASLQSWEYGMTSCSDGQGGLLAFWTVGDGSPDVSPGEVRALRFTPQGPVTGVGDAPAPGVLTLRGARFGPAGIRVTLSGPGAARGTLDVYDLLGRRLANTDIAVSARSADIIVPGTGGLPSGLYFLRARAGHAEAHSRVLVTR